MATGGTQAPWATRAHSAKAAASGGLFGLSFGGPAGAIIGAALGLGESIWSAKRADSAHQREVRDLERAGLNPMLSARGGGGSEVGDVGGASRGITSGLAAQRARAEIELLRAQTKATLSQSMESQARVGQITTKTPVEVDQIIASTGLANANRDQLLKMRDVTYDRIKAEIANISNSALRTKALTDLDKLDLERAENIAAFEDRLGEMSPAMRMSFEFLRAIATLMNQPRR